MTRPHCSYCGKPLKADGTGAFTQCQRNPCKDELASRENIRAAKAEAKLQSDRKAELGRRPM